MKRLFLTLTAKFFLIICFWGCGLWAVVYAENASETGIIRSMTYEEKLRLWNSFADEKKEAIRKQARHMSEEKFRQLKDGLQKIEKLEPEKKQMFEKNIKRLRSLAPKDQKQIIEKFQKFQMLPVERKRFYREKAVAGRKPIGRKHGGELPGRNLGKHDRTGIPGQNEAGFKRHENMQRKELENRRPDGRHNGDEVKMRRNEKSGDAKGAKGDKGEKRERKMRAPEKSREGRRHSRPSGNSNRQGQHGRRKN